MENVRAAVARRSGSSGLLYYVRAAPSSTFNWQMKRVESHRQMNIRLLLARQRHNRRLKVLHKCLRAKQEKTCEPEKIENAWKCHHAHTG